MMIATTVQSFIIFVAVVASTLPVTAQDGVMKYNDDVKVENNRHYDQQQRRLRGGESRHHQLLRHLSLSDLNDRTINDNNQVGSTFGPIQDSGSTTANPSQTSSLAPTPSTSTTVVPVITDNPTTSTPLSTAGPTVGPTAGPIPSVLTTTDTFSMFWLSRGISFQFITDLRPPTVRASCGIGGTISFLGEEGGIDVDDTTTAVAPTTTTNMVTCTTITSILSTSGDPLSTLECTSTGNSVFRLNEELSGFGKGIGIRFTCTGPTPESIQVTATVLPQTFNAEGQGTGGNDSSIFANVQHQLDLYRVCNLKESTNTEGTTTTLVATTTSLSACPGPQADPQYGFCGDEASCSDTCPNGSVCRCSLTVPAIVSYPVFIPRYDPTCLVETSTVGGSCFADGMCPNGGPCILGICQDSLRPDLDYCEDGSQCMSGYCEVFDTVDTTRLTPKACCRRGRWGGYTTWHESTQSYTCSRVASGMPCTGPNGCHSESCINGFCA